jgi:anti-anti-sigma factor
MNVQATNNKGILVVKLIGRLDFDSMLPFRRTCLERLSLELVVFDFGQLFFVGSVGLTEFVDTFKALEQTGARFRLTGLSSEFKRLFDANGLTAQFAMESTERAIHSLLNPSAVPAIGLVPLTEL